MTGNAWQRLGAGAKRATRGAMGVVAPALLHRWQMARVQDRYTRPPQRGPKRILLEATTACNYRCLMCTDHSSLLAEQTPAKVMPWERIDGLLRQLAAMGAEEVWLAGRGEPLTHPQAREIVALATSLGIRSMVTTNAGLLNDSLADGLCDAGLGTLSISINSASPQTYAQVHGARAEERARIVALMKRLSQRPRRPRLLASMVLIKPNLPELLAFAEEAVDAGAEAIDMLGLRCAELFPALALDDDDWARARRDIATAQARAARAGVTVASHCIPADPQQESGGRPVGPGGRSHWGLGCFIGYQLTRVDVDGDLHGCCSCTNHLASVDGISFAEAWHSPWYERFRRVCRAMPETQAQPHGCNCRDCGNLADNEEIHRQLQFAPIAATKDEGLASRLDLARIVWDCFGGRLPRGEEGAGFSDLTPEQAGRAWPAVAGLQAAKVMSGVPVAGGRPALMPRLLASRGDTVRVLERVASLLGVDAAQVDQLVASAAPALRDVDPLLRSEIEECVRAVRRASARARPAR